MLAKLSGFIVDVAVTQATLKQTPSTMIQGQLRDVPVAEVIQVIANGQKSGVLTVVREAERAQIYVELGCLQYAHLSPGIQLGEILLRMELLTSLELQEILLNQPVEDANAALGMMAVQLGLINTSDLERALKAQVLETLGELLGWRSGNFQFTEHSPGNLQIPTGHALDAGTLLLEVAQRLAAWQRGSVEPAAIFVKAGDPTQVQLPQGGWEVLGYVDGKRSAGSIAAELDVTEKQVYHLLFELQRCGVVRPLPFEVQEPRVLVISGSSAWQSLIRLSLRRARLIVDLTGSFDEGLALLGAYRPQAIVIDDREGKGREKVKELRKLPGQGHVPVLILTDQQEERGIFRGLRSRAMTLKRPFEELELQQQLSKMVGQTLG